MAHISRVKTFSLMSPSHREQPGGGRYPPVAPRSLVNDGKKVLDRCIDAYNSIHANHPTSDTFRPGVIRQKLFELYRSEAGKEQTLRMLLNTAPN